MKQKLLALKKEIGHTVNKRLREFSSIKGRDSIFKELCFCLLTANYSAEGGIRIQQEIGNGFLEYDCDRLAKELKRLGHRFPNARAKYIAGAQPKAGLVCDNLSSMNEHELREWLAENIKGLGMKEASHFMRNIGFSDVAIIDFHIIDLLVREGYIERPKILTKKRYLEIETVLRELGKEAGMNLAELDLYLWYMETGKILK